MQIILTSHRHEPRRQHFLIKKNGEVFSHEGNEQIDGVNLYAKASLQPFTSQTQEIVVALENYDQVRWDASVQKWVPVVGRLPRNYNGPALQPYEYCRNRSWCGWTLYDYITPSQITALHALLEALKGNQTYQYQKIYMHPSLANNNGVTIINAHALDFRRNDLHPQIELINMLMNL